MTEEKDKEDGGCWSNVIVDYHLAVTIQHCRFLIEIPLCSKFSLQSGHEHFFSRSLKKKKLKTMNGILSHHKIYQLEFSKQWNRFFLHFISKEPVCFGF